MVVERLFNDFMDAFGPLEVIRVGIGLPTAYPANALSFPGKALGISE